MDLREWIGRSETGEDMITAAPLAGLAATLDCEPSHRVNGDEIPPLAHWLYFLPAHRASKIGEDGHPRRGGFLPPVPLPRRMWAGGEIEFHRPLRVGDRVTRRSTIDSVSEKSGRAGALVFVQVRHEIFGNGSTSAAITERQDLVYREAPRPGDPAPAGTAAPPGATWQRQWTADEVMLFRFSALTFNAHRIHYDHGYATGVEGYPALVVHGPLIATLLLALLADHASGRRVRKFRFRGLRPLFAHQPFTVCGEPDGDTVQLWAKNQEGAIAMDATADLA